MRETVSVIAVAVSVLILAWQSYLLRRQTSIQTRVAIAEGGDNIMTLLHSTLHVLVEEPELRCYFYGGAKPPEATRDDAKVETIAEMLADCVESGMETAASFAEVAPRLAGWRSYGRFLLENSPATGEVVRAHPDWYPRVLELAQEHQLIPVAGGTVQHRSVDHPRSDQS